MQRIRIRYTKEGKTRFVSARDLTSVWERALRRADLPIAYSEGFTPHPKVSFPDALPVGVASTGEYAELTFAGPIDAGPALAALSATLPAGMDILTYMEVPDGAPKLARLLRATLWELVLPATDAAQASDAVTTLRRTSEALLAADAAEVIRTKKDRDVTIDVRAPLVALRPEVRHEDAGPTPTLRAVLRNDGPTVRPADLWAALTQLCGSAAADDLGELRLQRRVAQGEVHDDGVREALSGEVVTLEPERLAGAA